MTPRATPLPPDQRRAAIIRAAQPLLLEHGGHFTTKQVAEAAGIAEGTLFRVFATKRDLMLAVIEHAMDPAEMCEDLAAIDAGLPLQERVEAALRRLQRSIGDVSAIFGALFTMPTDDVKQLHHKPDSHTDPETRARHQEQANQLHRSLVALLEPDADTLACTPDEAASLLRSMAFATAHPHITDHRVTDPALLTRMLLHGLTQPSPTPSQALPRSQETSC